MGQGSIERAFYREMACPKSAGASARGCNLTAPHAVAMPLGHCAAMIWWVVLARTTGVSMW